MTKNHQRSRPRQGMPVVSGPDRDMITPMLSLIDPDHPSYRYAEWLRAVKPEVFEPVARRSLGLDDLARPEREAIIKSTETK